MRARLAAVSAALLLALPASAQELAGHAGPVSALAAAPDALISGGFDGRAIQWDRSGATARRILRFHDGNVTAVATAEDGFVSAGQDGRVALWREGQDDPVLATERGASPVSALAASGRQIVAGFFDGSLMRIDPATGEAVTQPGHEGRVAGLALLPEGDLVSVGADLRFARWRADGSLAARSSLPELPNGLARAGDIIAVVSADGVLRLHSPDGGLLPDRFLSNRPLLAVAASEDRVAAADVDGTVWLLDLPFLVPQAEIATGHGPVWALAMAGDALFSAGADGVIRQWSARDGAALRASAAADAPAPQDASRGAEVYRACAVCHSLAPGDHSRAGPSLYGVFGRPIASAEGYAFSDALKGMDIVWTPETVAELFTHGPDAYTPGSRMPDQRVTDPADRQALVDYIARHSR